MTTGDLEHWDAIEMERAPFTGAIAFIGGTGLYEIETLTAPSRHVVRTPFGAPSDACVVGTIENRPVIFLPRHGRHHHLLPSEINVRANIMALKSLGAEWCIGIGGWGSLRESICPGDFVVPDQLFDRTTQRDATFFGNGAVAHVAFGDPFCPEARGALIAACTPTEPNSPDPRSRPPTTHDRGTYVCMEGPAFSTRAESEHYRALGGDIIGMTALPEAKLAREAELGYASLALVTDYDCWHHSSREVDVTQVLTNLRENGRRARECLPHIVASLARRSPSALAATALRNAFITPFDAISDETKQRLRPIARRYLAE